MYFSFQVILISVFMLLMIPSPFSSSIAYMLMFPKIPINFSGSFLILYIVFCCLRISSFTLKIESTFSSSSLLKNRNSSDDEWNKSNPQGHFLPLFDPFGEKPGLISLVIAPTTQGKVICVGRLETAPRKSGKPSYIGEQALIPWEGSRCGLCVMDKCCHVRKLCIELIH